MYVASENDITLYFVSYYLYILCTKLLKTQNEKVLFP